MESPPSVVSASVEDMDAVCSILADAFANDPCMNWVIPAPHLYPRFYHLLASKLYMHHDMVYVDSEHRSAAMWLPPGVDHSVPGGATQLWLVLRLVMHAGFGVLPRLDQAQRVMAKHHPKEPHYYLHAVGVRQGNQGLGLGSALLKHVTRRCDADAMPAYLESSSPLNIPLYERHGFEVTHEEPIGEGGPPLAFMWREPRRG